MYFSALSYYLTLHQKIFSQLPIFNLYFHTHLTDLSEEDSASQREIRDGDSKTSAAQINKCSALSSVSLMYFLIKFKNFLTYQIASQRYLPACFTGKVHEGADGAETELSIYFFILIPDIRPKLLSLLQILFRSRS